MNADALDILETLQADVAAALSVTPALQDAVVIADNEGDIEARVARALAPIKGGSGGKGGLAVVVLLPEVTEADQNLPGPPLIVRIEVRTIENVLINRGPGGTGVRSSQAALAVLRSLHFYGFGPHYAYPQADPVSPVEIKPGHVSHAVTLFIRAAGVSSPTRPAQVGAHIIEIEDVPHLTLTCPTPEATIRYTLNGTFPAPPAALYTDPIAIPPRPALIRAAAYAPGMHPGPVSNIELPLE